MIAVVDYRAGNLTSVANALTALGHPFQVTDQPDVVAGAERVLFPGVGAAGAAMDNLRSLGLDVAIRAAVASGRPFMGICIGCQVLFAESDEDAAPCLGVLPGRVVAFSRQMPDPLTGRPLKIPQMGWNAVRFLRPHPVWDGVPEGSEFYFVHSYHPDPAPEVRAAVTHYGIEFASAVAWRNVVAFQFHPEKSGRPGLGLLDSFARWQPG